MCLCLCYSLTRSIIIFQFSVCAFYLSQLSERFKTHFLNKALPNTGCFYFYLEFNFVKLVKLFGYDWIVGECKIIILCVALKLDYCCITLGLMLWLPSPVLTYFNIYCLPRKILLYCCSVWPFVKSSYVSSSQFFGISQNVLFNWIPAFSHIVLGRATIFPKSSQRTKTISTPS